MISVVAIMDRAGFEANTDNLVVVQPEKRQLLWIPRDLWCNVLHDRVNTAFNRGGNMSLLAALNEHYLNVAASLCFSRQATEAAFTGLAVTVPIPIRMKFFYPLSPTQPIEEGSKEIVFTPPGETLQGERIHQWLGARAGSDLHRIERQKIFVRRLIEQNFDFTSLLANPEFYQCSDPQL